MAGGTTSTATRIKVEDELAWLRILTLGSLCLQCYILSSYCTLRSHISLYKTVAIPRSQISRTSAAEAFSILNFCCCFFNFYSLMIARRLMVYAQQRGFWLNFFPVFWGCLVLGVANPKDYILRYPVAGSGQIRYVWKVQIGHVVFQTILFLLFIAQFPLRRPARSEDGPPASVMRFPLSRNNEPKSLSDPTLRTVPTTWKNHLGLFILANTAPIWLLFDLVWMWVTWCIPEKPHGTPRRSANVASEFYSWWYITRVGTPPFLEPVSTPFKVFFCNVFYSVKFTRFRKKVDKEVEEDTQPEMVEEGRVVVVPTTEVQEMPSDNGRHEMDGTPAMSEMDGVPALPELAHGGGVGHGYEHEYVPPRPSRPVVYAPRRYAPAVPPSPVQYAPPTPISPMDPRQNAFFGGVGRASTTPAGERVPSPYIVSPVAGSNWNPWGLETRDGGSSSSGMI